MAEIKLSIYNTTMIHLAKKSLGQNFLKSEPALRMMIESGDIQEGETILEIGPGKGVLTARLLEKAGKVIAIEKDRDLVEILKERFKDEVENKKLEIIEGDCLEFDLHEYKLKKGNYKLIANIPYNITGAIIKRFLSEVPSPKAMILLVQKEVAERIVARNSKESILSLSVKAYGTPHYMMKVGKRFFSPAPKVDSAIVAIIGISRDNFKTKDDEDAFFAVVRASFAHKRKVVRKNLEEILGKEQIAQIFTDVGISADARAEDLSFETFLAMSRELKKAE
jgi:16S rRNA (adenine1518-N6/adenine1519-N6)-dimethyltransferase